MPSPRGKTWAVSAIHGDSRRGIGILANPIYCGRQVWNRSRWIKHPDTGRRLRKERQESEWIITEHRELAIVDSATWDAVQARARRKAGAKGRPIRYLFSGILRCAECNGPMVVVDRYRYGCATAKDRGTCASTLRVARAAVDDCLLAGIREQLLSETAYKVLQASVRAELRRQQPDASGARQRLAQAVKERENLLAALRAGIITPSTRQALIEAEEQERQAAEALQAAQQEPAQIIPRLREIWRRWVAALADKARDIPAAREAIREIVGGNVVLTQEPSGIIATLGGCQIAMVAGARSGHYLTEPIRIPIKAAKSSRMTP